MKERRVGKIACRGVAMAAQPCAILPTRRPSRNAQRVGKRAQPPCTAPTLRQARLPTLRADEVIE